MKLNIPYKKQHSSNSNLLRCVTWQSYTVCTWILKKDLLVLQQKIKNKNTGYMKFKFAYSRIGIFLFFWNKILKIFSRLRMYFKQESAVEKLNYLDKKKEFFLRFFKTRTDCNFRKQLYTRIQNSNTVYLNQFLSHPILGLSIVMVSGQGSVYEKITKTLKCFTNLSLWKRTVIMYEPLSVVRDCFNCSQQLLLP